MKSVVRFQTVQLSCVAQLEWNKVMYTNIAFCSPTDPMLQYRTHHAKYKLGQSMFVWHTLIHTAQVWKLTTPLYLEWCVLDCDIGSAGEQKAMFVHITYFIQVVQHKKIVYCLHFYNLHSTQDLEGHDLRKGYQTKAVWQWCCQAQASQAVSCCEECSITELPSRASKIGAGRA